MLRAIRDVNSAWSFHCQVVADYLSATEKFYPEDWLKRFRGLLRSRNASHILDELELLPITVYGDGIEYTVRSQLVALFKKYEFEQLSTFDPAGPKASAITTFNKMERRCGRFNKYLRLVLLFHKQGRLACDKHKSLLQNVRILEEMRRYISYVLGETPDLQKIYAKCDFGPGASIGVANPATNIGRKLSAQYWSVSQCCIPYVLPALWENHHIREYILSDNGGPYCHDYSLFREKVVKRLRVVNYNKIAFVPKSYKTYRSIAVEPLLNGYLQKGIDQYMRERLLRVGVDLSDQSKNSELARIGSLTGEFSTVDLSSASDTLSKHLVKVLLPNEWWELLDSVRSHSRQVDSDDGTDEPLIYEKFVSMGNGFCFPLQTLIFKAVLFAVSRLTGSREQSCVYGDDIIVCKNDSLLVLEILRWIGFIPNPAKTFVTGSFRESCGTDWYSGQDIRPAYLTSIRRLADAFIMHNTTRRRILSPFFSEVRERIRSMVPKDYRFVRWIEGSPESAFEVPKDLFMGSPHTKWSKSSWSWTWKELMLTPVRDSLGDDYFCKYAEYVAFLRGSSSKMALTVRGFTNARVRRISYWGRRVI